MPHNDFMMVTRSSEADLSTLEQSHLRDTFSSKNMK
jgi:hypothetical protein